MLALNLTVEFLSDWHIGEGAGRPGHVDRLVRRHPADNLPYVPAKTLVGIWRDACEQIAHGLDNGEEGPCQAWVKHLFGGTEFSLDHSAGPVPARNPPVPARVSVRPARLPDGLRQALAQQPALAEALTFIKPGIKLNHRGVAEDKHLRFEEVVIAGTLMTAPVTLDLPADAGWDFALALLWAGTRIVERMGGKRRRGHGCCKIALQGTLPAEQRLLALLGGDPPSPPAPARPPSFPFDSAESRGDGPAGWHIVHLDITPLTPVIAHAAKRGNIVASFDYLPGTYVLGAIHQRLRQLLGGECFPAVVRGDIRVLNAYPRVQEQRGLPAPLAWYRAKEAPGEGVDIPVANFLRGEPADAIQRKQLRQGYLVPAGDETTDVVWSQPDLQASVHATIDDRRQRPTTDVGGVYTYQAIRPHTPLRAELRIRQSLLADIAPLSASLSGQYRLGTAKKDDYGLVALAAEPASPEGSPHSGFAQPPQGADDNTLTLWLTSPLLLRDPGLRPTLDPDGLKEALENQLGIRLGEEDTAAFLRAHRDEGFQRAWGLARPSRIGFAAGSVLRWRILGDTPPDTGRLRALQAEGLGERRAEGYGELLVNPVLLQRDACTLKSPSEKPRVEGRPQPVSEGEHDQPAVPGQEQCDTTRGFEWILLTRAWRLQLRRESHRVSVIADERRRRFGWSATKPANSQLGALASQLDRVDDQAWQGFTRWIEQLLSNNKRSDKWPPTAKACLEALIKSPDHIWTFLAQEARDYPVISSVTRDTLKHELRYDAVRTLWLTAIQAELKQRTRGSAIGEDTRG